MADLSKISTTKPTDINSRFLTSDEILKSKTSSISPNQSKTFSVYDTAQVIKTVQPQTPTKKDDKELLKDIPESSLKALQELVKEEIGEIENDDDLNQAIVIATEKLNHTLFVPSFVSGIDQSMFVSLDFQSQKTLSNINKDDSYFKQRKGLLAQLKTKSESFNKYKLNLTQKYKVTRKNLKEKTIGIIEKTENTIKFFTDPNAQEYFSEYPDDTDVLNDLKTTFNNTLKYVNETCEDLNELFRTFIMDVSDIIEALNKLLNTALAFNVKSLFEDIINCFKKLKSTINDMKNVKNIEKALVATGSTNLIDSLFSTTDETKINYKAALYTTLTQDKKRSKENQREYSKERNKILVQNIANSTNKSFDDIYSVSNKGITHNDDLTAKLEQQGEKVFAAPNIIKEEDTDVPEILMGDDKDASNNYKVFTTLPNEALMRA